MDLLLDGDKNVSELVELVGSPQGRVSSHLTCLKWCGFVVAYREGKHMYYTIANPSVRDILKLARQLLLDNAQWILSCQVIEDEKVSGR